MRIHLDGFISSALCFVLVVGPLPASAPNVGRPQSGTGSTERSSGHLPGQSATLLPNGRLLLVGGEGPDGPVDSMAVENPSTGEVAILSARLLKARAGHTATLLPDGSVLILGGAGRDGGAFSFPEIFDPNVNRVTPLNASLSARSYHSATLLTDGTVLIAGGISPDGGTLRTAELWNYRDGTSSALSAELLSPRSLQTASLLSDGSALLWGGRSTTGSPIGYGEVFDPLIHRFRIETDPHVLPAKGQPRLVASIPDDRSENVPQDAVIALRFSRPMGVETVNPSTVTLEGAEGMIAAKVIPAEGGRLAFVTPKAPLAPQAEHTLTILGASDASGEPLPRTSFSFTTGGEVEDDIWIPGNSDGGDTWHGPSEDARWRSLPPLQGPSGVTSLAGQVLKLNGHPLVNATLSFVRSGSDAKATTDKTGQFLLTNIPSGQLHLLVNGETASRPGKHYCSFLFNVDVQPGITNVLPFTIWVPLEDLKHATRLPVPTTKEVVAKTPLIPGLEVHIPAGVILRMPDGHVMDHLSITPIPVDRPPFESPASANSLMNFTLQGHGAPVETVDGKPSRGMWIVYPNLQKLPVGSKVELLDYDAFNGFFVWSQGTVTRDGKQIVPKTMDGLKKVNCFSTITGMFLAPPNGPTPGDKPQSADGEPVDLRTGLFVYEKNDLVLDDTVPIVLKRTYRQMDSNQREFGFGFTHNYALMVAGVMATYANLILPDGGRIYYGYDSSLPPPAFGKGLSTPTAFYKSTIYQGAGWWSIGLKDGTTLGFVMRAGPPGYSGQALVLLGSITDRNGNKLTVQRDLSGQVPTLYIQKVISPHGRWIEFTTDPNNGGRITQARDSIGRVVSYQYNASGRLSQVTDAAGGAWLYAYDANGNMLTIQDARGIVYLTNQYDANNRVVRQTQADGSVYQFVYTVDQSGNATQTTVTDPRGNVRIVTFNADGYVTSDTKASGKPEQQTVTYTRQSGTNLRTALGDALSRQTTYGYDSMGNVTGITSLAGTPNAVTTTLTYETNFNQVSSVTDPLNHTTSFGRDGHGNVTTITDPLNHQTILTYDSEGKPLTFKDALNNTTTLAYDPDRGDLLTVTDPLNRTITRFPDSAGRLAVLTDPVGKSTRIEYNALNQITRVVDAQGGVTSFTYDPNGNLLSVTDALNHTTQYTYENMDRVATRKDPLLNIESYQYDLAGNLIQFTDRRGKVATFAYDGLNRATFAGYGTQAGPTYESTVSYTFDAGNRVTQAVDSITGTITRGYDSLDRLTSETTAPGTVSYAYDAAGRRASLTVPGQTVVNYTFDNADRLTGITQGATSVSFSYDNADRRATLTLPNGIVATYGYDNASQLTGMTYTLGGNAVGNLTYAYDTAGRRTSVGGSFARTGLPLAVSQTAYNANNQLTQWGTANLFYDANGNMTSDGTHSYTWDARDRLTSVDSGATASFLYDPFGRRINKSVLGTTTNFLYDGANTVQEIINGSNFANTLTGALDEYFIRTDSAGARTFLTDALGSTLALADSTGTLQTSYTFEPFGNTTLAGSTTTNTFGFTGRELDATGLYFYRARFYSPGVQRFISEDPLDYMGAGSSLYGYVENDPSNKVDPTGQEAIAAAAGAGCVLGGPPGCAIGAAAGGVVDVIILGAAVLAAAEAASVSRSVDIGGDDPAFANPEATAAAIAEILKQLADKSLSTREREALKRRLNELRRRPSKKAHGADKLRDILLGDLVDREYRRIDNPMTGRKSQ